MVEQVVPVHIFICLIMCLRWLGIMLRHCVNTGSSKPFAAYITYSISMSGFFDQMPLWTVQPCSWQRQSPALSCMPDWSLLTTQFLASPSSNIAQHEYRLLLGIIVITLMCSTAVDWISEVSGQPAMGMEGWLSNSSSACMSSMCKACQLGGNSLGRSARS